MGHTNLETTMACFYLTRKGAEDAYDVLFCEAKAIAMIR